MILNDNPKTKDATDAVYELAREYQDRYGFENVQAGVRQDKREGIYEIYIAIDGERGKIEARVQANRYQVEDIHAARGLIPKLHTNFMKLLYKTAKETIW